MSIFTSISHKYSLRIFLKRLFKSTTTQKRPRHSTDTVPGFHAETPQATVSEGVAQGPYVAARAGPSGWKVLTQPMRHHVQQRVLTSWLLF